MAEEKDTVLDIIKYTLEAEGQFTDIIESLEKSYIDENGTPKFISSKILESMSILNESKHDYQCCLMLVQLIQRINLIFLQNPSVNNSVNNKYQKFLDYLNQQIRGNDFDIRNPIELSNKESSEFQLWITTIVAGNVGRILKNLCDVIDNDGLFFECDSFVSDQQKNDLQKTANSLLSKVNSTNNLINSNKMKLTDLQKTNVSTRFKLKKELTYVITQIIPSILDALSKNDSFYNNILLHIEHMETKVEYLQLKMELAKQDLYNSTYNDEDNLKALKNVKSQLERKLYVAKNKLAHYKRSLDTYNNLGADFKTICDKYTALQKQYENKKWALDSL